MATKPSLADLPDIDATAPMGVGGDEGGADDMDSDGPMALGNFLDSIGVPQPADMKQAWEDFKKLQDMADED